MTFKVIFSDSRQHFGSRTLRPTLETTWLLAGRQDIIPFSKGFAICIYISNVLIAKVEAKQVSFIHSYIYGVRVTRLLFLYSYEYWNEKCLLIRNLLLSLGSWVLVCLPKSAMGCLKRSWNDGALWSNAYCNFWIW